MITPLQKIKDGLKQGNLQLIAEGYKDLTGETVKVKESQHRILIKRIKQLIANVEFDEPTPSFDVPNYITEEEESEDNNTQLQEEQTKNKPKRTRAKKHRPPKKPILNKCAVCGVEFEDSIHNEICRDCIKKQSKGF